jgi:hypothetical protein
MSPYIEKKNIVVHEDSRISNDDGNMLNSYNDLKNELSSSDEDDTDDDEDDTDDDEDDTDDDEDDTDDDEDDDDTDDERVANIFFCLSMRSIVEDENPGMDHLYITTELSRRWKNMSYKRKIIIIDYVYENVEYSLFFLYANRVKYERKYGSSINNKLRTTSRSSPLFFSK